MENNPRPQTYFAAPGRARRADLMRLSKEAFADPIVNVLLDAVNGYLLIVDQHRQAIACNADLLQALGLHSGDKLVGLRQGELLHCQNVKDGPGGCGTSQQCRHCGALLTLLSSMDTGKTTEGECTLSLERDGSIQEIHFEVRCTPLTLGNEHVTAMVLLDDTDNRRIAVLDQLFFHDIKNILQALMGYGELIDRENAEEAARKILSLSNQVNEQLDEQYFLKKAERGEIAVNPVLVDAAELLSRIGMVFEVHAVAEGKRLSTKMLSEDIHFVSDSRLLTRVVVNMVKNAFEAVPQGHEVIVRFERIQGKPRFSVWNPGAIPIALRAKIFKESFTTKKSEFDRGLGTRSIKLFGERYLGGNVEFSTSEEDGTTFFITLPNSIEAH